jgi:peroxiredoxin
VAIAVGDRMPEGTFGAMIDGERGSVTAAQLFAGKKVVLVSVPGAFTPTCSMNHLPGYVDLADELAAKGVDTIACMAVNDLFVMAAWGEDRKVGDKVLMLADGNGDYTRALGLELDARSFGMGMRGQRFAIIADDGVATHVAVEAPARFEVSKAEAILAVLQCPAQGGSHGDT